MTQRDLHRTPPDRPAETFAMRAELMTYGMFFADEVIGPSLRLLFDDIANAPLPDPFAALLERLESTEQRPVN
jgi:hypothetical protein